MTTVPSCASLRPARVSVGESSKNKSWGFRFGTDGGAVLARPSERAARCGDLPRVSDGTSDAHYFPPMFRIAAT
jgi:hypothetical protein